MKERWVTAPAHYAIGAASALFVQNFLPETAGLKTRVAVGFLAAFASHISADAIPHAEHFLRGRYLAAELLLESVLMLVVLVGGSSSPLMTMIILAGMAGAAAPDGLGILNQHTGWSIVSWASDKLHVYHGKLNLFYASYFWQLVFTVLCSIYVRIKSA